MFWVLVKNKQRSIMIIILAFCLMVCLRDSVEALETEMVDAYVDILNAIYEKTYPGAADTYRAFLADLDNNGTPELILIQDIADGIMLGDATVFYWDGNQICQAETVDLEDSYSAYVYCDSKTGDECFLTNVDCLEWTEAGGVIDESVRKIERLCFNGYSAWKETVEDFSQYSGQPYTQDIQDAFQSMKACYQESTTAVSQPLYSSAQSGFNPTADDFVTFVNSYQYCGFRLADAGREIHELIALLGKSRTDVEASGLIPQNEYSYWDGNLFFTGVDLYGAHGTLMADYTDGILQSLAWESTIPEENAEHTVKQIVQELDASMTPVSYIEGTEARPADRAWDGPSCQAKTVDSTQDGYRMFGLYLYRTEEIEQASGAFSNWEGAYQNILYSPEDWLEDANGWIFDLIDLNQDGTPELVCTSVQGARAISGNITVFTFRDNAHVQIPVESNVEFSGLGGFGEYLFLPTREVQWLMNMGMFTLDSLIPGSYLENTAGQSGVARLTSNEDCSQVFYTVVVDSNRDFGVTALHGGEIIGKEPWGDNCVTQDAWEQIQNFVSQYSEGSDVPEIYIEHNGNRDLDKRNELYEQAAQLISNYYERKEKDGQEATQVDPKEKKKTKSTEQSENQKQPAFTIVDNEPGSEDSQSSDAVEDKKKSSDQEKEDIVDPNDIDLLMYLNQRCADLQDSDQITVIEGTMVHGLGYFYTEDEAVNFGYSWDGITPGKDIPIHQIDINKNAQGKYHLGQINIGDRKEDCEAWLAKQGYNETSADNDSDEGTYAVTYYNDAEDTFFVITYDESENVIKALVHVNEKGTEQNKEGTQELTELFGTDLEETARNLGLSTDAWYMMVDVRKRDDEKVRVAQIWNYSGINKIWLSDTNEFTLDGINPLMSRDEMIELLKKKGYQETIQEDIWRKDSYFFDISADNGISEKTAISLEVIRPLAPEGRTEVSGYIGKKMTVAVNDFGGDAAVIDNEYVLKSDGIWFYGKTTDGSFPNLNDTDSIVITKVEIFGVNSPYCIYGVIPGMTEETVGIIGMERGGPGELIDPMNNILFWGGVNKDEGKLSLFYNGSLAVIGSNDKEYNESSSGVRALELAQYIGDDYAVLLEAASDIEILEEREDETKLGNDNLSVSARKDRVIVRVGIRAGSNYTAEGVGAGMDSESVEQKLQECGYSNTDVRMEDDRSIYWKIYENGENGKFFAYRRVGDMCDAVYCGLKDYMPF